MQQTKKISGTSAELTDFAGEREYTDIWEVL